MSDVTNFLADVNYDKHPSFKFPTIGTKIVGRITSTPRVVNTTDMNGEATDKLVVDVENVEDKIVYAVWIKKNQMAGAVAKAVSEAGANELAEGGSFALAYVADGTAKPGQSAPKLWEARYTAPVPSVDPTDVFGDL